MHKRVVTLVLEFEDDVSDQMLYDAFTRTLPTPLFGLRGNYAITSIQRSPTDNKQPDNKQQN